MIVPSSTMSIASFFDLSHPANIAIALRMNISFSADRPISSVESDILRRGPFAVGIAQSIASWSGSESLVIGILGEWGTGKTSIKNMVLEHLHVSSPSLRIVEFAPWQLSGTGSLMESFFNELAAAHGQKSVRKDGVIQKIQKYVHHLRLAPLLFSPAATASSQDPTVIALATALAGTANVAADIVAQAGKATNAESGTEPVSLMKLKQDVAKCLSESGEQILVVIDDIDRLDTDEILQIVKLVKANADFPNLIYLLLFDRAIVEKALDKISGERGREFLEKIVQVPFHVPYPHRAAIEKVLFHHLDQILVIPTIQPLFDQIRWNDIYLDGVRGYLENLRDVYRFLTTFSFHVGQFSTSQTFEVNPIDLIALECLRIFEPALYEQIPAAKRILIRERLNIFGRIKQEEVNATIDRLLELASKARLEECRSILHLLFPAISSVFDNDEGISFYSHEWLRNRRVCHPELFDKYFARSVAEDDLSQLELENLIKATANRESFVRECRSLLNRSLLTTALQRLDAYKEEIPLEHMPALITALCDLGDDFPEPKSGWIEVRLDSYAWRLIYFGLKREADLKKRLDVLLRAFLATHGLDLPVYIVSLEQRTQERTDRHHEFLVEEEDVEALKNICLDKILKASKNGKLKKNPQIRSLLIWWFNNGDKNVVRSWVESKTKKSAEALWFLKIMLSKMRRSTTKGTKVVYYIDLGNFENFASPKRFEALTRTVKSESLTDEDREAVIQFRKALQRRREGKPDDDWKNEQ